VGERVCLRCDWTGETDGAGCPHCGAALYRQPESTEPREVTPMPRPQPHSAGDRVSSSPVEAPQEGGSVPPAVPVAASRRWWLIGGGAFAVAAVLIVATGGPFDRTQQAVTRPTVPPASGVSEVDYVIDLDTGVMTPLPEAIVRSLSGQFGNQYAVSPDGSRLAYVKTRDRPGPLPPREQEPKDDQIFIAGIDGTGVRQVTHAPNGAWSPTWSPDGTRIAYEGLDSGHHLGLYVLDVASGESTRISGLNGDYERCCDGSLYPGQPLEPQFTPDGSSLVYTGGSAGNPVIRTVPVVGGESTLLIGRNGNLRDAENGSLSPEGSLVTFLGSQIGGPGLRRWVANTDGTERRLLPDVYGIPCRSTPTGTWSADGSRIVCSEASRVIVIDIATGAATPVAYGRAAIWLDDHTLLVSI
jgi:Tol biopolymer transport system component